LSVASLKFMFRHSRESRTDTFGIQHNLLPLQPAQSTMPMLQGRVKIRSPLISFTEQSLANLLKPNGYVMHRQV